MVVCKCRKATKLYCFVHKVPVCGECICFPEHQICVIRTYSEWVIDGEYDWPPTCCFCNAGLEGGAGLQTTRLGCLHLMHTNCLVSHIQSFPPQTPPTGYTCPACTSLIWPPKSIKDTGSCLHSKLKEAINKSGLGKNLFGNLVTLPPADFHAPPPAFASDPIAHLSTIEKREVVGAISLNSTRDPSLPSSSAVKEEYTNEAYKSLIGTNTSVLSEPDIVEIEGPTSVKSLSPAGPGPGATTRKATSHTDRQNLEFSYYADDEDGSRKKYNKRGSFRHKFLRLLLPFWSSSLPTLPVTAPPRRDGSTGDDVLEGRLRHQRSSKMDPRKILLTMAIMACMATMGILYYRLAQRNLGKSTLDDEQQ